MSEHPVLLYLEPDDEITGVVRRVREAAPGPVILVAPGRSRATSSAVALRLLARVAEGDGRSLTIVGDPLTRSLAAEADLAAFGSVDEARAAAGAAPVPAPPRHATIHVVRGDTTDATAPTVPVAPSSSPAVALAERPDAGEATRPARALRTRPAPPARADARATRRRPARGPTAVLAVAAALVATGVLAGATVVPAATVTITPRTETIRVDDEIVIEDPGRPGGTVEASAAVEPTGTYEVVEAATGTVTFRNFNVDSVQVPEGTLVAAGDQAFQTTEGVSVPSGSLTPDGRIQGGEESAPVVAAAAGPAANVPAGAIDTVLSEGVAAGLRGFSGNTARLVINYEETSGGVDRSGAQITESDVATAVDAVRERLADLAAEAVDELRSDDLIVIEAPPTEPEVEIPEGLVGTRDPEPVEIDGFQEWRAFVVERADVEEAARALIADEDPLEARHELLPGTTAVTVGDARLEGDRVVVPVTVTARSTARLERDEVIARTRGRSAEEAEAALADLGRAEIELWPGWVTTLPELEWRVDVRIGEVEPAAGTSPTPEATP